MNSNAPPLLLHLAPDDPEPLREQIARQLRNRIVRGEMQPGERLAGHRQVARQNRVAPSTVEAAYEMLAADALITGVPGDEIRVARIDPERRQSLVERLQLEELVAQELGRRELEMARDVQRRLLPPSEIKGDGWEVAARCVPARVVAGDFYDVLRRADGDVDIVVADVAGKGFGASLIMASVKAMLPFVTAEGGVAESLTHLNGRLASELGRGELVALTLVRFRPSERLLEVANGGAPDPYLVRPGRMPRPLSVPGPRLPLGIRPQVAYASRVWEVGEDESLVMMTDGLPEARDAGGEPLGYKALESMLAAQPAGGAPAAWLSGLFDQVQQQTGRLPEDDWTAAMLVPRGCGEAP